MEHTNTIAIHSEGDFHYDHYASLERVNVIILDVEEAGGLFSAGKNVLIIPTSLYIHTQLHATIEQSVDADGIINMDKLPVCLKGDPDHPEASFIGVNREEGSITENIDSIITREGVPLADAQAILDLLLQNETGYIVNIATTARAETLGIADDVLDIIPWDSKTYVNSVQGKVPVGFLGWLWQVISGFFKAIWDFFVWLFEILAEFGLWLIGLIASAVMALIEAAIKLIILVIVFIILAIILLGFVLTFPFLLIILYAFADVKGGTCTPGFLNAKLIFGSKEFFMGIEVKWANFEPLDLNLPYLSFIFKMNDELITQANLGILTPQSEYDPIQLTGTDPPGWFNLDDLIFGITLGLHFISIYAIVSSVIYALMFGGITDYLLLIVSLAASIALMLVYVTEYKNWIDEYIDSPSFYLGMCAAAFFGGFLGFLSAEYKIIITHPTLILEIITAAGLWIVFMLDLFGVIFEFDIPTLIDDYILMGFAMLDLFVSIWVLTLIVNSPASRVGLLKDACIWMGIALASLLFFIVTLAVYY